MFAFRVGLRAAARAAKPSTTTAFRLKQAPRFQQRRLISWGPRYQRFGQQNQSGGGGKQQQWSNFGPVYRAQYIWRNYRTPVVVVGAGGSAFYVYNLEDVPVSHRRRFNVISPATEKKLGDASYDQLLQEYKGKILPTDHPYTKMVAKVVERLLPSTGGLAGDEWRVHVINDPNEKNAFVIPGGKVFVFTGILPICKDEDGLAAVLSHEIAHNLAHHVGERISRSGFVFITAYAISLIFDVSGGFGGQIADLFFSLPNSRTQELEADYIGLLMMAESCYDPQAAADLWTRMKEAEKFEPPQFMSTHPGHYNRREAIVKYLPEAQSKFDDQGCRPVSQYAADFKDAFKSSQGLGRGARQGPTHPSSPSKGNDDDYFF